MVLGVSERHSYRIKTKLTRLRHISFRKITEALFLPDSSAGVTRKERRRPPRRH
jgi:hypothetical protein